MKTTFNTFALMLAVLLSSAAMAQEPALHKELEAHRIKIAKSVSRFTVSVEIDFDHESLTPPSSGPAIPGMGGADPDDPFTRYDIGPFSGLIVAKDQILISDRTLGDFSKTGAGPGIEGITITLPNGDRYKAKVMGRHQEIDLALLKIDADLSTVKDVAIAAFGSDETKLERGQQIFVVGRGANPIRAQVNDGIVSALGREQRRAFQLDARVGNATLGAPVCNNNAELVGVVTFHNHATFGQASGVSYAAYMHEIKRAYGVMKEGKFVERPKAPFMGIGASKKWPDKPGLEVGNIVDGSGAEKAGIRVGDIILQVDGVDMTDVPDLITHIQGHAVGDVLKVKFMRDDKELEVSVTLGPRP
ncbi:MAG: PDZ domain-containing protein [Planctomycetes bacterium]|nr:PDZ domain-containing protein [Planctomycetota bacterium]